MILPCHQRRCPGWPATHCIKGRAAPCDKGRMRRDLFNNATTNCRHGAPPPASHPPPVTAAAPGPHPFIGSPATAAPHSTAPSRLLHLRAPPPATSRSTSGYHPAAHHPAARPPSAPISRAGDARGMRAGPAAARRRGSASKPRQTTLPSLTSIESPQIPLIRDPLICDVFQNTQGLTLPDAVLVRKSYEDKRRRRRARGDAARPWRLKRLAMDIGEEEAPQQVGSSAGCGSGGGGAASV